MKEPPQKNQEKKKSAEIITAVIKLNKEIIAGYLNRSHSLLLKAKNRSLPCRLMPKK